MKHRPINIEEEEIRVVGSVSRRRGWGAVACVVAALAVAAVVWWKMLSSAATPPFDEPQVYAPTLGAPVDTAVATLPTTDNTADRRTGQCAMRDTTINDVGLRIATPTEATPTLEVGALNTMDRSIAVAVMAADIRSDNLEIVGAFVERGRLVARGQSKQGFCAIVDGRITIGMAASTPLLEEAIERDGYFFRQYAYVHEGQMVENKPKGKSMRRALCQWPDGSHSVVLSLVPESMHDFAQALADIGAREAIALVGGDAEGIVRPADGMPLNYGVPWDIESVNFIVWRIPPHTTETEHL